MNLPNTRQFPFEPEKIESEDPKERLIAQKKLIKELSVMYEDLAKAHNALAADYIALEARVVALEP